MSSNLFGEDKAEGENPEATVSAGERLTEEELAEARKALIEQQVREQQKLLALESAAEHAEDDLVAFEARQGDFEQLQHACEVVEELAEKGISELFWGQEMVGAAARAQGGARPRPRRA